MLHNAYPIKNCLNKFHQLFVVTYYFTYSIWIRKYKKLIKAQQKLSLIKNRYQYLLNFLGINILNLIYLYIFISSFSITFKIASTTGNETLFQIFDLSISRDFFLLYFERKFSIVLGKFNYEFDNSAYYYF